VQKCYGRFTVDVNQWDVRKDGSRATQRTSRTEPEVRNEQKRFRDATKPATSGMCKGLRWSYWEI
jgi:hypothetical protein